MIEKPDIKTREDIIMLVNAFYQKVNQDALLSPYFNEVAKINWDHHLPNMYNFWETVLLGKPAYHGNPLKKHVLLHQMKALTAEAFSKWLMLFHKTIDEHFQGSIAQKAKFSSTTIAQTLQARMDISY